METKITFEEYLRKENLSENTITSYLWTVSYFNANYDVVSKENLLNRHSNRHFYVSEKKSPKELLSPQIIFFFIEGSPVDDPTVLQNRSTMGVQIPSTFPKSLDFKPFQLKVRFPGKL